jgi:uncharacterized OsmC-like protein
MSEKSKDRNLDFEIDLKLKEPPFQFEVDFKLPEVDEFVVDEPPDIGGEGKGPNASRVLASAIGFCLSASLTFCLRKSRLELKNINTKARGMVRRNEDGYWRIKGIQVDISPIFEPDTTQKKIDRCKELFERYCIVTSSVRKGIPIEVKFV